MCRSSASFDIHPSPPYFYRWRSRSWTPSQSSGKKRKGKKPFQHTHRLPEELNRNSIVLWFSSRKTGKKKRDHPPYLSSVTQSLGEPALFSSRMPSQVEITKSRRFFTSSSSSYTAEGFFSLAWPFDRWTTEREVVSSAWNAISS